jgi:hypothetical protein
VLDRDDGDYWEKWLQTHRVELNAMTTPQFIEWLANKMAEHKDDKLIPPPKVLTAELDEKLEAKVRAIHTERILREAGHRRDHRCNHAADRRRPREGD